MIGWKMRSRGPSSAGWPPHDLSLSAEVGNMAVPPRPICVSERRHQNADQHSVTGCSLLSASSAADRASCRT